MVRVVERDLGLRHRRLSTSPARSSATQRRRPTSPRAHGARQPPCPVDAESFRYLDAKQGHVAGVPCAAPSESASSANSATRSTSRACSASTCSTRSSSRAPTTTSHRLGLSLSASFASRRATSSLARTPTPNRTCSKRRCPGSSSSTRTTSSVAGRPSTSRPAVSRRAWSASGSHSDHLPAEGGQIVEQGQPVGRITSARRSEAAGGVIGLGWVPAEKASEGEHVEVRIDGSLVEAEITLKPFYDPDGERLRS